MRSTKLHQNFRCEKEEQDSVFSVLNVAGYQQEKQKLCGVVLQDDFYVAAPNRLGMARGDFDS